MKEKCSFGAYKESEQLVHQKPKLPDGFQENIFKGKIREGGSQGVRSAHTILWLVDGEVTGQCHRG